ncbi:MAG: FAD-dependent oxidoreductase, partial [Thermoleophilia bacterium]|nr:FAD-dependent oxidoreductase [Thermoleophilia bacterium]
AAFGRAGYKNFFRLLDELGIKTRASAGGFISVHDLNSNHGFYVTPSPRGLLAQRLALLRPSRLLTLWRLSRGIAKARRIQAHGGFGELTMREGLLLVPQLTGDAETLLLCALCLLSSMSGDEVLDAPASFFFEKLDVHHDVISPRSVYSVRTIPGGTQTYVNALARAFDDRIALNARIRSIDRGEGDGAAGDDGIRIVFEDGGEQRFDKLVLACNPDQALELLAAPTPLERELLSAWRYKDGPLVLHRDYSAFPKPELMQAFTFLYRRENGGLETSVNGSLRFLAGVPRDCDLIGSQHPNFAIRKDLTEFETVFRTPIFDFRSCATVPRLSELNGTLNTYYCGSYFGHGLHEDAVSSALAVARDVGAEPSMPSQ